MNKSKSLASSSSKKDCAFTFPHQLVLHDEHPAPRFVVSPSHRDQQKSSREIRIPPGTSEAATPVPVILSVLNRYHAAYLLLFVAPELPEDWKGRGLLTLPCRLHLTYRTHLEANNSWSSGSRLQARQRHPAGPPRYVSLARPYNGPASARTTSCGTRGSAYNWWPSTAAKCLP